MNTELKSSMEHAEALLNERDKSRLAELVEAAVASWSAGEAFPNAEIEHLRVVAEEPFVAADPEEVAALFANARG